MVGSCSIFVFALLGAQLSRSFRKCEMMNYDQAMLQPSYCRAALGRAIIAARKYKKPNRGDRDFGR
jgi:hypothetical protein